MKDSRLTLFFHHEYLNILRDFFFFFPPPFLFKQNDEAARCFLKEWLVLPSRLTENRKKRKIFLRGTISSRHCYILVSTSFFFCSIIKILELDGKLVLRDCPSLPIHVGTVKKRYSKEFFSQKHATFSSSSFWGHCSI